MDNDLDTLATALYASTDNFLKGTPELAPWRSAVGLQQRITDAELVTVAVMQALLGFTSECRWLRHARVDLIEWFPYLPEQSDCTLRLRHLGGTLQSVIAHLGQDSDLWADGIWIADSTPVECGRSRETAHRSDLAGFAETGYCASHSRWFWGLRLHLLCTLAGMPVGFALTGAKADETQHGPARDPGLHARHNRGGTNDSGGQELLRQAVRKGPGRSRHRPGAPHPAG